MGDKHDRFGSEVDAHLGHCDVRLASISRVSQIRSWAHCFSLFALKNSLFRLQGIRPKKLVFNGFVLGVMNAAFWGHLEGHLRGVVICDNDPAEFGAIVFKGVIWLIALICLVVASISLSRDLRPAQSARG